jgi:hypothetical protein
MAQTHTVHLGTISHGTLRPEDLIPAFAAELARITEFDIDRADTDYCGLIIEAQEIEDFDDDDCREVLANLEDALNTFAPDYCYFGACPGDGADFGFWLCEDWQQQAEDDGVLFVSDLAEVPEDFPGGLIAHVNDHGNAALYLQDYTGARREVWSVV